MSQEVGFFNEFEEAFEQTPAAKPGGAPMRVPPGFYKVMATTVKWKGHAEMIDHETIIGQHTGTKGFRLFLRILEPDEVHGESVMGQVIDLTLWLKPKTLPFVKRDIATILGHGIKKLAELLTISWAGRTCEIEVEDDFYGDKVRSRVKHILPWKPTAEGADQAPAGNQDSLF